MGIRKFAQVTHDSKKYGSCSQPITSEIEICLAKNSSRLSCLYYVPNYEISIEALHHNYYSI